MEIICGKLLKIIFYLFLYGPFDSSKPKNASSNRRRSRCSEETPQVPGVKVAGFKKLHCCESFFFPQDRRYRSHQISNHKLVIHCYGLNPFRDAHGEGPQHENFLNSGMDIS